MTPEFYDSRPITGKTWADRRRIGEVTSQLDAVGTLATIDPCSARRFGTVGPIGICLFRNPEHVPSDR
jgi:hypothetical protein